MTPSASRPFRPGWVSQCIDDLLSHIDSIELKIAEYDRILAKIAAWDSRSKNIMKLRGVGPTTASALIASIGSGHDFKNGRQLARGWV